MNGINLLYKPVRCGGCARSATRYEVTCCYCGEKVAHTRLWLWLRQMVWLLPLVLAAPVAATLHFDWSRALRPTTAISGRMVAATALTLLLLPPTPTPHPMTSTREMQLGQLRYWLTELAFGALLSGGLALTLALVTRPWWALVLLSGGLLSILSMPLFYRITWYKLGVPPLLLVLLCHTLQP